jgi:hypothetical protein
MGPIPVENGKLPRTRLLNLPRNLGLVPVQLPKGSFDASDLRRMQPRRALSDHGDGSKGTLTHGPFGSTL